MPTLDEAKAKIKDIGYKYSHNDELMEDLKVVNDALSEGEIYGRADVYDGDERWCDKYEALKKKYVDRFFNGDEIAEVRVQEPVDDEDSEVIPVTVESLFKEE